MYTLTLVLVAASAVVAAGLCISIISRPSDDEEYEDQQTRARPVEGFSDDPWAKSSVPPAEAAARLKELQANTTSDTTNEITGDEFLGNLIIDGALDALNANGPFLSKTSPLPVKFMIVDMESEAIHYASAVVNTSGLQLEGALDGEFVPSTTIFTAHMNHHYSEKFSVVLNKERTGFEAKGLIPTLAQGLLANEWNAPLNRILETGIDLTEMEIEFECQDFTFRIRGLAGLPELLKPTLIVFMELAMSLRSRLQELTLD